MMRYQVIREHHGGHYWWKVFDTKRWRTIFSTPCRISAVHHASCRNWQWRRQQGAIRRRIAPIMRRHGIKDRTRITEELIAAVLA